MRVSIHPISGREGTGFLRGTVAMEMTGCPQAKEKSGKGVRMRIKEGAAFSHIQVVFHLRRWTGLLGCLRNRAFAARGDKRVPSRPISRDQSALNVSVMYFTTCN